MKKIYYGIIFILSLFIFIACQTATNTTITDNKEEQQNIKAKKGEYTTLIQYDGDCYHYNQADTLIKPEKEAGEIKSITETEYDLPTEDWQVNVADENWIGKKIYINENEDAIYIQSDTTTDTGKTFYECYVKGAQKKGEITDGMYYEYVTYDGQLWLLEHKVRKKIPKKFKMTAEIHSYGEYYMSKDYSTNLYPLFDGKIYTSEKNKDVIYVEAVDGSIWKAEPDKN